MKITKDYLRTIIRECMHDMVDHRMPPIPNPPSPMLSSTIMSQPPIPMDPDGYEGRMAKGNLFKAAESAALLHNLIQDGENLEPWVQEKIAIAAQSLVSVADYLKYEKMRGGQ